MNTIAWPLVELAAKLLEREEREAVIGDLLETSESAWRSFLDVFSLVVRRQAGLWKNPRPWLAGFVVALPCSYLLTTVSISVSCTWQRLINHKVYGWHWPTGHEGFPLLFCHIFLSHRLVLDRRLHCGLGFAPDPLDERCIIPGIASAMPQITERSKLQPLREIHDF